MTNPKLKKLILLQFQKFRQIKSALLLLKRLLWQTTTVGLLKFKFGGLFILLFAYRAVSLCRSGYCYKIGTKKRKSLFWLPLDLIMCAFFFKQPHNDIITKFSAHTMQLNYCFNQLMVHTHDQISNRESYNKLHTYINKINYRLVEPNYYG